MKHLIKFESYHDEHLNQILDKINQSGIDSLSQNERDYLDAYSNDDEDKMTKIEYEEGKRDFVSNDGYFKFTFDRCEDYGSDGCYYFGTLYCPSIEWSDSNKKIEGVLEGSIILFPNGQILPDFEKDGYDVLEFCNGIEYELDSFLQYVIDTIEDEKTVE